MARTARQSKLIEIITNNEIETQDELVMALRNAGFEITQATISRDIKELGLIKIVGQSKKYKYAFIDNDDKAGINRGLNIFKESVIWVKSINNNVILKTIKGTASLVAGFVDKIIVDNLYGCVFGDDTIMAIATSNNDAEIICRKIGEILFN